MCDLFPGKNDRYLQIYMYQFARSVVVRTLYERHNWYMVSIGRIAWMGTRGPGCDEKRIHIENYLHSGESHSGGDRIVHHHLHLKLLDNGFSILPRNRKFSRIEATEDSY